jgi:solute carrier family 34 (sodium-dependent phosphate cotransporter)
MGKSFIEELLYATANPFIGLFIGLIVTAIIHSSSTTTSIVVAVVSTGAMSIENAVPIIMGANIGTTVTSTIVALAYITDRLQYRKAIAAGTVHDFFNIITVMLLFPLEYYFQFLSGIAKKVAVMIPFPESDDKIALFDISFFTKPVLGLFDYHPIPVMIFAIILLFISIKTFSMLIKRIVLNDPERNLQKILFSSPLKGLSWGAGLTGLIQSSSVTTSMMVPMVAGNSISLKNAFPFILGANIGTTITAVIAAINKSEAAFTVALCHVLFNVIGVLLIFPIPYIRSIPVRLAQAVGLMSVRFRIFGLIYIITIFFFIPFVLISFNKPKFTQSAHYYQIRENNKPDRVGKVIAHWMGKEKGRWNVFADSSDTESKTQEIRSGKRFFQIDSLMFPVTDSIVCVQGNFHSICRTGVSEQSNIYSYTLKPNSFDSLPYDSIHFLINRKDRVIVRKEFFKSSRNPVRVESLINGY